MSTKIRILLKLTGAVMIDRSTGEFSQTHIHEIIKQIKQLNATHKFGIVIGGGNLFRGSVQGKKVGLSPWVGHHVGILATAMNGVILKDLFEQKGLSACHLSALDCQQVGLAVTPQAIGHALKYDDVIIFSGGTGNPFFTTDTSAVLRALQVNAAEVWKGTAVDGIFDQDPLKNPDAKKIPTISYAKILEKKLGIMDTTAYALAEQHKMKIRVFDIFTPNALLQASNNAQFGSTIE